MGSLQINRASNRVANRATSPVPGLLVCHLASLQDSLQFSPACSRRVSQVVSLHFNRAGNQVTNLQGSLQVNHRDNHLGSLRDNRRRIPQAVRLASLAHSHQHNLLVRQLDNLLPSHLFNHHPALLYNPAYSLVHILLLYHLVNPQ